MGRTPILGVLADDDTRGRQHALGRAGESMAANYLKQQGIAVLDRNWRCPQGELDIVASDGDQVIFCEVKTRSGVDYGSPGEAVSSTKVRRLRHVARAWLNANAVTGCQVRFDVISVLWPPGGPVRIEHLQEVF